MKCINKTISTFLIIIFTVTSLTGCGQKEYGMPYNIASSNSSYTLSQTKVTSNRVTPFASDLCVVDGNVTNGHTMEDAGSAGLFNVGDASTIYAQDVFNKLYPASLTKVMTALVALKYGSPDTILKASSNVKILESGAQVCGIKEGDTMTLDQALHILLIYSANDVAILIAEGIGGSVEGFADLMNQEAQALGATGSHFANPHGLHDDNHYVTAYDMYLIFNEAMKYDLFNEIIQTHSYDTVYYNSEGNSKELSVSSTNLFFKGDYNAPENVTVIGGKTGTTNAAGHCLILLSRDTYGKPYISIVMKASEKTNLYSEMVELLNDIP